MDRLKHLTIQYVAISSVKGKAISQNEWKNK